jgi:hypothetical protein
MVPASAAVFAVFDGDSGPGSASLQINGLRRRENGEERSKRREIGLPENRRAVLRVGEQHRP